MSKRKNLNLERLIKIDKGNYRIGINKDIIESISRNFPDNEIKKEFLLNSYPEHNVEIEEAFISRYHVTLFEFKEFINNTGYTTEAEIEGWGWVWDDRWTKKEGVSWRAPFGDEADKLYLDNCEIIPVLMVSCNDAQAYCEWLSGNDIKARLPSEIEWEIFSGLIGLTDMEVIKPDSASEEIGSSSEYIKNLIDKVKINKDMNYPGLLWEWTNDWFDSYPSGIHNKEFGRTYKVLRGGSFVSHPIQRTRQYRFRRCPTARSPFYGFRIIME